LVRAAKGEGHKHVGVRSEHLQRGVVSTHEATRNARSRVARIDEAVNSRMMSHWTNDGEVNHCASATEACYLPDLVVGVLFFMLCVKTMLVYFFLLCCQAVTLFLSFNNGRLRVEAYGKIHH
jgi:hypothetical protein